MIGLNIVDIIILVALGLYVAVHIGEGFVVLSRRLLAFLGSLVFAFLAYADVAAVVGPALGVPPGLADALSFLLVFVVLEFLFSYFLEMLFSFFPHDLNSSPASKILAIIPASVDGLILISLTLLLLVIMPVFPEVKQPIERSHFGGALVNRIAGVEGYVDKVFGRATQETLGFLTIQPEEGDFIELPFTAENLSVDSASEQRMLELVNAERAKVGAPPLVLDAVIVPVARAHSVDMWEKSYFAHENPEGESPFDRMTDGGVRFLAAGENLALARTVERAHIGLMNSPGHRRNILDPEFGRIGIGVIDGGVYGKMFTQNFAD